MDKVIVLGASGMAGHMVYHVLLSLEKYEVVALTKNSAMPGRTCNVDIRNHDMLYSVLKQEQPAVVINCIGLLIGDCEKKPDDAILINSYLPHFLSKTGAELGFKLIHLTTDCVFSGKDGGYTESSFRDGDSVYARSRAMGEIVNSRDLSVRTSLVGPEVKNTGSGLLNWFLNQHGTVNGYTNAFWTGVTTLELALAIDAFIEQKITGLYHFVPERKISKYDLLMEFKKHWNSDLVVEPLSSYKNDKSLVCTRTDFEYNVRDYSIMVSDLCDWMREHKNLYPHYHL